MSVEAMNNISFCGEKNVREAGRRGGFSLIEVLVVISIISILMGILLPVLGRARRQARNIIGMSNQREIVLAVNNYAADNDGRYPESVATVGQGSRWSWQEPTALTGFKKRSPNLKRSVSGYLYGYINDASVMFCPKAPRKYEYLQQAWDAGDQWQHPQWNSLAPTPLFGTYCFYWNYTGYLNGWDQPFKGPKKMSSAGSGLLISDYFGLDHWRNALAYNGNCNAYGSCERIKDAAITPGTAVSADFWSRLKINDSVNLHTLRITLNAGYTDGHVESYSPKEVIKMEVSLTPRGDVPYPQNKGPGGFYIPRKAMY